MYIKNVEKEVSEGRLKILPLADEIEVRVDVLVHRDVPLPPIGEKDPHDSRGLLAS